VTIPYGAAKAGLNIMAKGFVKAWGDKVRVNTIIPGAFLTDVTRFWETIPEGIAAPEEMVGAVLFLSSHLSDMVVGHVLMVDGGWTIQ